MIKHPCCHLQKISDFVRKLKRIESKKASISDALSHLTFSVILSLHLGILGNQENHQAMR